MTDKTFDNPQEARQKLWQMIGDIKFAMLTTKGPDGTLRSRPLTTQNGSEDEGSRVWFFISASSELAQELRQDPQVNLAYSEPADDVYVSVSGTAHAVDDPQKKQQLWSPIVGAWFPEGVGDPDVMLLAVEISDAEYWEARHSKMVQLVRMAAASVTGNPPSDMTEHRRLNVS